MNKMILLVPPCSYAFGWSHEGKEKNRKFSDLEFFKNIVDIVMNTNPVPRTGRKKRKGDKENYE